MAGAAGAVAMRVAVGQFGGPTPVFNETLAGVMTACVAAGVEAWGIWGGPRGLVAGDLRPLPAPLGAAPRRGPGAHLGAGRLPWGEAQRNMALHTLEAGGIDALVLIGGNGTMALAWDLAQACPGLRVVGVPKTIDNDLAGTDRAPGYRSAATFTVQAAAALGHDLQAMAGFEDVRVVEVMGRRAGWLAASARVGWPDALVLLPEVPWDVDRLCEEVAQRHRSGPVLVVVAEGVRDAAGREIGRMATDAGGSRQVYGQAASVLAAALRTRLGLAVRAESLGFLPRCFFATEADRQEAASTGARAVELLRSGVSGVMVSIGRDGGLGEVPLGEVAGRDRLLPKAFRDLGRAWHDWLLPLLADALDPPQAPRD